MFHGLLLARYANLQQLIFGVVLVATDEDEQRRAVHGFAHNHWHDCVRDWAQRLRTDDGRSLGFGNIRRRPRDAGRRVMETAALNAVGDDFGRCPDFR